MSKNQTLFKKKDDQEIDPLTKMKEYSDYFDWFRKPMLLKRSDGTANQFDDFADLVAKMEAKGFVIYIYRLNQFASGQGFIKKEEAQYAGSFTRNQNIYSYYTLVK